MENTKGWNEIMNDFYKICRELGLREETISGKDEQASLKKLIVEAYNLGKREN